MSIIKYTHIGIIILIISEIIKIIGVIRYAKKTNEIYTKILSCIFFHDLIPM